MSSQKMSPSQSIDRLHQEALNLLYTFAESTRDAARAGWTDPARRERGLQLAAYIKRDLVEFKNRLDNIQADTRRLPGKVLAHPHHPELLAVGGKYLGFIEDVTAALSPMSGELVELLAAELNTPEYAQAN